MADEESELSSCRVRYRLRRQNTPGEFPVNRRQRAKNSGRRSSMGIDSAEKPLTLFFSFSALAVGGSARACNGYRLSTPPSLDEPFGVRGGNNALGFRSLGKRSSRCRAG